MGRAGTVHQALGPHCIGNYIGDVRGLLFSYSVSVKIAQGGDGLMLSLQWGNDETGSMPLEADGRVLEFDPTHPGFVYFLESFSFKNWPNHSLVYHSSLDILRLRIGWYTYDFRRVGSPSCGFDPDQSISIASVGSHESNIKSRYIDRCRVPQGKYCGHQKSFAFLTLDFGNACSESGMMDLSYRETFSLPWSTKCYSIPFEFRGTNLKFESYMSFGNLSKRLAGPEIPEFAHCVHHAREDWIEFTLFGSQPVAFKKCS